MKTPTWLILTLAFVTTTAPAIAGLAPTTAETDELLSPLSSPGDDSQISATSQLPSGPLAPSPTGSHDRFAMDQMIGPEWQEPPTVGEGGPWSGFPAQTGTPFDTQTPDVGSNEMSPATVDTDGEPTACVEDSPAVRCPAWAASYSAKSYANDFAADATTSPDGTTVYVTGLLSVIADPGSVGGVENRYVTLAYDAATGEEQWNATVPSPGG